MSHRRLTKWPALFTTLVLLRPEVGSTSSYPTVRHAFEGFVIVGSRLLGHPKDTPDNMDRTRKEMASSLNGASEFFKRVYLEGTRRQSRYGRFFQNRLDTTRNQSKGTECALFDFYALDPTSVDSRPKTRDQTSSGDFQLPENVQLELFCKSLDGAYARHGIPQKIGSNFALALIGTGYYERHASKGFRSGGHPPTRN